MSPNPQTHFFLYITLVILITLVINFYLLPRGIISSDTKLFYYINKNYMYELYENKILQHF